MKRRYFSNYDKRSQKRPWLWIVLICLVGGIGTAAGVRAKNGGIDMEALLATPLAWAEEKGEGGVKLDRDVKKAEEDESEKKAAAFAAREKEQQLEAQKRARPFREGGNTNTDSARLEEEKMKQMKDDLTKTLESMREMQNKLDERMSKQHDSNVDEQSLRLARLIRVVSGMRAEDAAKLLPEMEEDLAVKIMLALSSARASKVMGGLPPKTAASISAKMVALKPDPKLKDVLENWKGMLDKAEKEGNKGDQGNAESNGNGAAKPEQQPKQEQPKP